MLPILSSDEIRLFGRDVYRVIWRLLGFSFHLAWIALILLSPTLTPYETFSTADAMTCKSLFLLGLLVSLFINWKISKPLLSARRLRMYVIALFALCPFTLMILLLPQSELPTYVTLLLWFLFGFLAVAAICVWSTIYKHVGFERAGTFFSLSLCAAMLVFLIVALSQVSGIILMSALPVFSGLCYIVSWRKDNPLKQQVVHFEKCTSRRMHIVWHIDCAITTSSFCLGFGVSCAALAMLWPLNIIIPGMAVFMTGLLSFIDSKKDNALTETFAHRAFFLIVFIGGAPLIFLNIWIYFACCTILLFLLCINLLINFSAMATAAEIYDLPSVPYACRGKIANVSGALLGYVAAFFYIAYMNDSSAAFTVQAVVLAIVLLFGVAGTFMLMNLYPTLLEEKATTSTSELVNKRSWSARCDRFSNQNGLSSRQREVLKYLSRGRNASYIAETLYISESTVKVHIYSIYKKAGIHSVQELIDAIESLDVQSR